MKLVPRENGYMVRSIPGEAVGGPVTFREANGCEFPPAPAGMVPCGFQKPHHGVKLGQYRYLTQQAATPGVAGRVRPSDEGRRGVRL